MAKKVVAGLKKATTLVKVIRPIKSDKTGKYKFREDIIDKENVQNLLKG
ncbi:MAG: DUF4295 family protein [Bacteroidetes bacterium]|jgi:hypothetical protein|nr:DUF4295 family protein [Bacteroidota bacterium]MBT3421531.1 DUF4295 family protein [Bacteroidota bacterium]MBT3801543.1 DUF4295 family protein [Bacteroidota bacterium]MBT3933870.1 DUF4295 family protein [Bacteroidota bacterium]MBT4337012.1 DUF4295 family protein [Bacteroidota bacterium]